MKPSGFGASKKRHWQCKPKRNEENLPLVEAVKLELAGVPTKTPVTILQELLCKRGTIPKYELVQIEGAIHEPTFRYRVTFGDKVASGIGRSKKEAKHAAAQNVLLKVIGKYEDDEGDMNPNEEQKPLLENEGDGECADVEEKEVTGNPIGTLQEMCMAKRWPPPNYEMVEEVGLPHERLFTISCTLLNHRELGLGKSKKLAKRQAASKMWSKLQETASELEEAPTTKMKITRSVPPVKPVDLKTNKTTSAPVSLSQKISLFHRNLKDMSGKKISELQTNPMLRPNLDVAKLLRDIALEQQFHVTYVEVDEKSCTGLYQCLVQMSTFPVAVCYGSGKDLAEAESNAAMNALEYLKIMTMK